MFTYWDSPSTLLRNLAHHIIGSTSAMGILGIRWLGDNLISNSVGRDELALPTIPFSQNLC